MRLNDAQREAVEHNEGPLMVIAGAGSGKTRVLTNRIARLIEEGTKHYNILAVTFTNKAAKEMKDRVLKTLDYMFINPNELWVSTFHAVCLRILKRDIDKLGYSTSFGVIDTDDSRMIIKRILKDELNLDTKEYTPQNFHGIISKMNHLENPKDHLKVVSGKLKEVIEKVYDRYQEYKRTNNILDFDDLINLTIELLEHYPDVLEYYQDKFKYILIDEFQDTNNLQFRLVDLLCKKHKNVFIVGDMDQSIYSFRGANYENINKFTEIYNPKIIKLEENYRSTKYILQAANSVIKRNENRIDKTLRTTKDEGEKITYFTAPTSKDEASFVRRQIELLVRNGAMYSDFAILYRMNAMSREFEQEFNYYRIPYKVYGGMSFFERKEIKDLIAYLRLIVEPNDNWSFQRVINEPKRGLGPAAINKLYDFSVNQNLSMFDAIEIASKEFTKGVYSKLIEFKEMITRLKTYIKDTPLKDFIDLILLETSYRDYMISLGEEGKTRLEYLEEFKSIAQNAEDKSKMDFKPRLEALDEMVMSLSLREEKEEDNSRDKVVLMSIHSAKGLEFPYVFLVGMELGVFPNWGNMDDPRALEEERRLCYVAMTRAEQKLYISRALNRMQYGNFSSNPESPFMNEIDYFTIEQHGVTGTNRIREVKEENKFNKNSFLRKENVHFNKGDKIRHEVFGIGIVISVEGDNLNAAFEMPHGVKKLMKNHTSITKL